MAQSFGPEGPGSSETVEPLRNPNPFELPQRIKTCLRTSAESGAAASAKYLWVHLGTASGSCGQGHDQEAESAPTLEEWLNVVDEAASLGVHWIILSINTSLTAFPDVIQVCQWAQDAHGMTVGLHSDQYELPAEELEALRALDLSKTQVVAKRAAAAGLKKAQEAGFQVIIADPQPYGERPDCRGPKEMLFVSPRGRLFTCGLVEDNNEYALGNIFVRSFRELLSDASLPHLVHPKDHTVTEGCDGCPALLANFLQEPLADS